MLRVCGLWSSPGAKIHITLLPPRGHLKSCRAVTAQWSRDPITIATSSRLRRKVSPVPEASCTVERSWLRRSTLRKLCRRAVDRLGSNTGSRPTGLDTCTFHIFLASIWGIVRLTSTWKKFMLTLSSTSRSRSKQKWNKQQISRNQCRPKSKFLCKTQTSNFISTAM